MIENSAIQTITQAIQIADVGVGSLDSNALTVRSYLKKNVRPAIILIDGTGSMLNKNVELQNTLQALGLTGACLPVLFEDFHYDGNNLIAPYTGEEMNGHNHSGGSNGIETGIPDALLAVLMKLSIPLLGMDTEKKFIDHVWGRETSPGSGIHECIRSPMTLNPDTQEKVRTKTTPATISESEILAQMFPASFDPSQLDNIRRLIQITGCLDVYIITDELGACALTKTDGLGNIDPKIKNILDNTPKHCPIELADFIKELVRNKIRINAFTPERNDFYPGLPVGDYWRWIAQLTKGKWNLLGGKVTPADLKELEKNLHQGLTTLGGLLPPKV